MEAVVDVVGRQNGSWVGLVLAATIADYADPSLRSGFTNKFQFGVMVSR